MIDTSGKAFPSAGYFGISVRDYFMTHAPAEPQPWFRPTMATERPTGPTPLFNLSPAEAAQQSAYLEDEISLFELTEVRVRDFHEAAERFRTMADEWTEEREKQRYVQWPAAWADEQLKARTA